MRRLVVGDIYGRIEALKQVLKLCNFEMDIDTEEYWQSDRQEPAQ